MKIENMISAKGNKIVNQFKITTKNKTYFQSYKSVVASIDKATGKVELYKDWNYSNTTRKYLYQFLWDSGKRDLYNKKQVEMAIKTGVVSYREESPSL